MFHPPAKLSASTAWVNTGGSSKVIVDVIVQLFASVTNTLYVPAVNPAGSSTVD
jgi:hypothetical protein